MIEMVCYNYKNGVSVIALARQMQLSSMKTWKILITGDCYSTDMSTEIQALYKDGKTVGEIAALLNMTDYSGRLAHALKRVQRMGIAV